MIKLLRYALFLFCCIGFSSGVFAVDDGDTLQKYNERVVDETISLFHNSLGFDFLTKEECDSLNITNTLSALDASKRYRAYFELERILIKSYLFRGELRLAIAQSDQMYVKARSLSEPIGNVLALVAIAEIYVYTSRWQEAAVTYEKALELLDEMEGEEVHTRMLLVELINYNLDVRNLNITDHFVTRLNSYSESNFSTQEKAICLLTNANYQLAKGNLEEGRQYLDRAEQMKMQLIPATLKFFQLVNVKYLTATGAYRKALEEYDKLLQAELSRYNQGFYKKLLQEKADLLVKMDRKEEAYEQYGKVFEYVKSSFEKNYPKEIEELSARFQADQLAYQNEQDRLASMHYYLVGTLVCIALLVLFLLLSWKKIFCLKHSQQRQEAMKAKAKFAIERKNLFLSNMSHEVRTPLNAIVGFSAILTSDDESFGDESRQEFCEIIKVNSFQLLKLINDILDFSDFENDNITFHIQSHNVVKLCHEVVETVMASRKMHVEMRFETNLPELLIETDDSRLRQVLINLLVNAAKFTEKGSIVLALKLADNNTALFSVTDTGCGIPLEKKHLIFERFEKLNDFVQGSGLGLSICRLIVNYMKGKIWVDSQYSDGARFCFTHPLKFHPEKHKKSIVKQTLLSIIGLLFGCFNPLMAEEVNALRYQDSILKVADALPTTLTRLTYLHDMAYKHQYAPFNIAFATRLYEESKQQDNVVYENQGAYYLAFCYDRKHDPDSLTHWVNVLKGFVTQVGTYDYYLERKAAISRALASKRQVEKAIYIAKETLTESVKHDSNNGMIAAYNSLGCALGVSSRNKEALDVFLKAYKNFTPQTKASLKVDILSRIAQVYGNAGYDSLRMPYLDEMSVTLQEAISKEPHCRKNWTNAEIDCEVKYILHYMSCREYDEAQAHLDRAKQLLAPHVDSVFWLNVQLTQLQLYGRTKEYEKSIALIDEVTPIVLNNYVVTFSTLLNYKASIQHDKGDLDGAIATRRYLIQKQDSLNNAFSTSQLQEIKELYHIDELLQEKQKIKDLNYRRGFMLLAILIFSMLIFYLYTRFLSRKIVIAEKRTAEAALQAEAENKTKERLKSEISHDVRTPLNAVVGFAELLTESDGLDKETKKEYGRIIQINAENLLVYINSILELSRLESGKTQYKKAKWDILQLCHQIKDTINHRGNPNVLVAIDTNIGSLEMQTDKNRFETLLTSLLLPIESDEEHYQPLIRIRWDQEKSILHFEVVNAPLAKVRFESKTSLIRHEINTHFVHYFGGTYEIKADAEEGPTVLFTMPH